MPEDIKKILDAYVDQYNRPGFIEQDPICIPHQFSKRQDIEITGFWVSMLAWGQRKTIINKARELIGLMDGAPPMISLFTTRKKTERSFRISNIEPFNIPTRFTSSNSLQHHYRQNDSLENAFSRHMQASDLTVESALRGFHEYFFSLPDAPARTRKHVATPARKSRCKRLNMFLRWMVRKDDRGVDFGLWQEIKSSQLLMPFDVHVERIARRFNLVERKQSDWQTVLQLTDRLRELDPEDPVKYDFALFGIGVLENQKRTAAKPPQ